MSKRRYCPIYTLMLVLALIICSFPTADQKVLAQDSKEVTPSDYGMKVQELIVTPSSEVINNLPEAEQAFQSRLAFLKSLSEEQRLALTTILIQYQPEFEAIIHELNMVLGNSGSNKLFLPLVVDGDMQLERTTHKSTSRSQKDLQVYQQVGKVLQKVSALQAKIDSTLVQLLTAEQKSLFQKSKINQQSEDLVASSLRNSDEGQNNNDCYYGTYYGGVAFYWAAFAEYYSYLDYYYVNNAYSYSNFYYNHYAQANVIWAVAHAATAWALSNNGLNTGSWDDTSYTFFTYALNDTYSGRYYAYQSWQLGSNHAYYAYAAANEAYAFEGLARTYIYYCY